jgi:2-iminoacetate synthase ThiH
MTDEQILELAKTCGFCDFAGDAGEDINYWDCEEEQLLKFAREIFEMGRESASVDGVY